MNILVSNDDGIQAKGLRVLTEALSAVRGAGFLSPHRTDSGAPADTVSV